MYTIERETKRARQKELAMQVHQERMKKIRESRARWSRNIIFFVLLLFMCQCAMWCVAAECASPLFTQSWSIRCNGNNNQMYSSARRRRWWASAATIDHCCCGFAVEKWWKSVFVFASFRWNDGRCSLRTGETDERENWRKTQENGFENNFKFGKRSTTKRN